MDTKKLLVGCAIGCAVLVVLAGIGGYLLYQSYLRPMIGQSAGDSEDFGPPGIIAGADLMTQRVFLADPKLGTITDISFGKLDPAPGVAMGIVGKEGAVFANAQGATLASVTFAERYSAVDLVDVEGDGLCEFINRGSWSDEAALLDHAGKLVWKYGGSGPGVDDMAAGDLDGDGVLEFAVGFNGGGGVHLVDRFGNARWRRPDANVWHVEIADLDGDGRTEIVHSNAGGQVTVRDAAGNIVRQAQPGSSAGGTLYFSHFSLCCWPAQPGRPLLLSPSQDRLVILDAAGTAPMTLDAPKAGPLATAVGTPVKLHGTAPAYFAAAVTFTTGDQSALFVYDASHNLVYREVLSEPCHALAALPLGKTGAEALLVGGEGKVWEYAAPTAASSR